METFSSGTSAELETHSQIKTPDDTKLEIVEIQEKISSLREQRKKHLMMILLENKYLNYIIKLLD
jgi:hypothetical protein